MIASCYVQVDKILQSIDSIQSKVQKVKDLHDRMLASPQAEEQDKNELENLMNEIKSSANRVRKSLKSKTECATIREYEYS